MNTVENIIPLAYMGGEEFVLAVLGIVMGGLILITIIKGITGIFKAAFGNRETRETEPSDTKMIQEIYQGLMKLEDRIETLETILMDRRRSRDRAQIDDNL